MRLCLGFALCLFALPGVAVEAINFTVLSKLPHSRSDFVQGLEIRENLLYQGTGIRGQSAVQVFALEDGRLLQEIKLPSAFFGEGITVFGDQIVQLTWKRGKAFVYRRSDLKPVKVFAIPGEGWGLTNDGQRLIYSDGSHRLRFIKPDSWTIEEGLAVMRNGQPQTNLNELEWTPQGLLANVWQTDTIVRIDMNSGEVTGEIDLTGLLPPKDQRITTDVLNGIAYNPTDDTLWVTGKNWPWLYQLRLQSSNGLSDQR
ncbi:MAG: glutaminyl-peptide cyclotransferase [Pseudomonadota bacterium]